MKIENLFKESLVESSSLDVEGKAWAKLETELKQKEFYVFSFYNFNVYYAGIILLSLITTASMMIAHYNHTTNIHHHTGIIETTEILENESKEIKEQTQVVPITVPEVQKLEVIEIKQKGKISLNNVRIEPIIPLQTIIDTSNNFTITLPKHTALETQKLEIPAKEKIKELDTIIIHQQDTIYHVDSIKVSKRKLKKLHKND